MNAWARGARCRASRLASDAPRRADLGAALLVLALLGLAAIALSGCETTAEESAKLEQSAKHVVLARTGLQIARASTQVKVLRTTLLSSSEGGAVAVSVRNLTVHPLHALSIAITATNSAGKVVFRNNAPGLEAGLTSLALLPAHAEAVWVNDQVPASGHPSSASAEVGQAPNAQAPLPAITVSNLRAATETAGPTTGTVRNDSAIAQQKLIVYVVGSRDGKLVVAGRSVVPELAPPRLGQFQAFLVGDAAGAQLQASAPATTLG